MVLNMVLFGGSRSGFWSG